MQPVGFDRQPGLLRAWGAVAGDNHTRSGECLFTVCSLSVQMAVEPRLQMIDDRPLLIKSVSMHRIVRPIEPPYQ